MENCYIAIGAIVKNEGRYIEEWIEYHRLIGVEKFYIVDNGSTDDTIEVLKKYIDMGIIELYVAEGKDLQLKAYNNLINYHRDDTKWIAFIDVDEFIYIHDGSNIKDFLKDYEEYNGLGINWRCIGPSGHKYATKGSLLANYNMMLELNCNENLHIKSIVQPKKTKLFDYQPHAAIYLNGLPAVNEKHEYIYGNDKCSSQEFVKIAFTEQHTSDKIAVLHYNTKSEEESYYRSMRGKALGDWNNYNVFLRFMNVYESNKTIEFNNMKVYYDLLMDKLDSEKNIDSIAEEGIQTQKINRYSEEMKIIQRGILLNLERHKLIKDDNKRIDACMECQEIAIAIGELVENSVGKETNTVKYLEIYCEMLYKICEENSVNNKCIELLNMLILKAGYSII